MNNRAHIVCLVLILALFIVIVILCHSTSKIAYKSNDVMLPFNLEEATLPTTDQPAQP